MADQVEEKKKQVLETPKEMETRAENTFLAGATATDVINLTQGRGQIEPISTYTVGNENPFEVTAGVQEASPFEQPLPNQQTSLKRVRDANGVAIAASEASQDLNDNQLRLLGDFQAEQVTELAAKSTLTKLKSELTTLISTDPAQAKQLAIGAKDLLSKQSEQFLDEILGPHRAYIRSIQNLEEEGSTLSMDEVDNLAVENYMLSEVGKILDELGFDASTGADVLGLLAVPDFTYDVSQIEKELFGAATADSMINTGDFIQKFSQTLFLLPPKQRALAFTKLKSELEDIESNKLKQALTLMKFLGEESDLSIEAESVFDKLDAIGIGTFLGGRIFKALKSFNSVKQLSKANNIKAAANLAHRVSKSDEMGEVLGISRLEAASSADPNIKPLEDILTGAPQDVASKIRDEWKLIDEFSDEAINVLDEGPVVSQAQKNKKQASIIKNLAAKENIENVRSKTTANGIELSYDVMNKEGAKTLRIKDQKIPYTIDDVDGTFKSDEVTFVGELARRSGVISPNALQSKDIDLLVQGFERTLFAGSKIKTNLGIALQESYKGLSRKQVDNVNKVLLKGDDADIDYTYQQLVNEGIGGIRLTEDEFASFTKVRRLVRNMGLIANDIARKEMSFKGVKAVDIGSGRWYSKVFDDKNAARLGYNQSDNTHVWVPDPLKGDGNVLDNLDADIIDKYYNAGYKLTKVDGDDLYTAGATHSKFALVPNSQVKPLPPVVVNLKPGYIPRVFGVRRGKDVTTSGTFFVKEKRRVNLDGKETVAGTRTLRYFDSPTEANKYIDQLELTAKEAGDVFDRNNYQILGDREMAAEAVNEDSIKVWGGLYKGARKEERLKFGIAGQEGARIDAVEALQNYIGHIGNRLPMSRYKHGVERVWLNSAKNKGVLPENYNGTFDEAIDVVERSNAPALVKGKLLSAHKQIDYMSKLPTQLEQEFSGVVRSLGRLLEKNKLTQPFGKWLYRLDHTNPIDAIRSSTFNLRLGLYNWSQFFLQASGATIAASVDPIYAVKAMPNMLAFSALDFIKLPSARRKAAEMLGKKMGLKNLAEDYEAWRKSGLYDSIINTNPDASVHFRGLPTDRGAFRKFLESGQMFFRMGESVNMRASFTTALARWRSQNPAAKLDDVAIKDILARSENYRLNMSQANKAAFQKGLASIPMQFQQVKTKFLETILPQKLGGTAAFSTRDKLMLGLGQVAFYGAAGVPMLDMAMTQLADVLNVKPSDMSEEEVILLRRGTLAWLINGVMDIDAVVTGRLAISNDLIEGFIDFGTEKQDVGKMILGPTASTADGIMRVTESFLNAAHITMHQDDLTPTDLLMVSSVIGADLASLPSSTSNMLKGWVLYNSKAYHSRDGKYLMSSDPDNLGNAITQALGFGSQDVQDMYELFKNQPDRILVESEKKEFAKQIVRMYHTMYQFFDSDPDRSRAAGLAVNFVLTSLDNPKDQEDVLRLVRNSIKNPKTKVEKLVKTAIKNSLSKFYEAGNNLNPLLVKAMQNGNEGQ